MPDFKSPDPADPVKRGVVPDDHVWITLEQNHLDFCETTAHRRRANAVEYNLGPDTGAPTEPGAALALDRIGLFGECAVYLHMRMLNLKWHAFRTGDRFPEPDLGDFIDVKTRAKDWHSLIVRSDDRPEWAYVLALVHDLPRVCLIGWAWGFEVRQPQFWRDPQGRGPAYFIPQDSPILRPMAELTAIVRRQRAPHPPGFVGYDAENHFVHYCHCGRWGDFGHGVDLLRDKLGQWFCSAHDPGRPGRGAPTSPSCV